MGSNVDKFMGMLASPRAGVGLGGCAELSQAPRDDGCEEGQSQVQRPREATAALLSVVGLWEVPPPRAGTAREAAKKLRELVNELGRLTSGPPRGGGPQGGKGNSRGPTM